MAVSAVCETHAAIWHLWEHNEEKGRLQAGAARLFVEVCAADDALFTIVPVDLGTARRAADMPREAVPDMPDRLIAATALALGVPPITKDARIRSTHVPTIW